MTTAYALFVFAVGLIIGSFLNVVIFRYNSGLNLRGRSKCFACTKTLRWYELVPLVSFLVLQGRCRNCKSRLSLQYFMVELITGVVFTLTVARLFQLTPLTSGFQSLFTLPTIALAAITLVAMAILIVVAVYDLRHKIIPDGLVYAFVFLALMRIALTVAQHIDYAWYMDIVSGALLSLLFVALWYFSHGHWMGLGDGKLVLGIGWFLPFTQNISAILIAFWSGAIVGVGLLLLSRLWSKHQSSQVTMRTELPFAPFLIGAFFLVFLSGIEVVQLANMLQFSL